MTIYIPGSSGLDCLFTLNIFFLSIQTEQEEEEGLLRIEASPLEELHILARRSAPLLKSHSVRFYHSNKNHHRLLFCSFHFFSSLFDGNMQMRQRYTYLHAMYQAFFYSSISLLTPATPYIQERGCSALSSTEPLGFGEKKWYL